MTSNDKIYGLVLAGGKSTRMGTDKAQLNYRGLPHALFLYELLSEFCDQVFMSVNEENTYNYPAEVAIIEDENTYRGPFNGLLSAHHHRPENAWLVLACDLPFVNKEVILSLIRQRNSNKAATAFATRASGLPEPLCALWEASTLAAAENYLKEGNGSCPRKFLLQNEVQLIYPEDDRWLFNANSPEDFQQAQSFVQK